MDMLKERENESLTFSKRASVTNPDSPGCWEPGSRPPQLSEWQGQGTDARLGHPGVSGKVASSRGSGKIQWELDLLDVKHLSGCQVPSSQG